MKKNILNNIFVRHAHRINCGMSVLMLILITCSAGAEIPVEEWNKTFGGDEAYSVQQTSDRGFILAGYTTSFGAGKYDAILIKTDANGNKEWNRTFGGMNYDQAESVQQTSDGGYIIAATTNSYSAGNIDAWLIKTDANGNEEWNRTFGGTENESANSIQQTSDGGYIFVGETSSYGTGNDDAWLIKTDTNGKEEWNRTFGGFGGESANFVRQTSDGGYVFTGGIGGSHGEVFGDAWLVKTDANGNEEWNRTFGGTDYDQAHAVQLTSDGGYIVAGETNSYGAIKNDAWLIKTDANGNEEWNKTFGGTDYDQAHSVQQTTDGGYILAGQYSHGAVNGDAWLIKTDANGDEQWNRTFGGTGFDMAYSVQQTSNGDLIVGGVTNPFDAGGFDVWLIRTALFPDIDVDGIPDAIELFGVRDASGNLVANMSALGADPCRKTIAVEIDYMDGAPDGHTHRPSAVAITEAIDAFNAAPIVSVTNCPYPNFPTRTSGVNLVMDVDDPIPEQAVFDLWGSLLSTKAAHFDEARETYFFYNPWVHDWQDIGSSGVCCYGRAFIVSLGSWGTTQNGNTRQQSGTFMHELGHNLGLGHGGSDGINYKPNYLSVMNYRWQTNGLYSSTGVRIDYSRSTLPTLNEMALNESEGISDGTFLTVWTNNSKTKMAGWGNTPLDWTGNDFDGNSITNDDTSVAVDINGDGLCVLPGINNILNSVISGDDIIDIDNQIIRNGANLICDSSAVGDDEQASTLKGFDDWANIGFLASTGSGVFTMYKEITFEEAQKNETFMQELYNMLPTSNPGDTLDNVCVPSLGGEWIPSNKTCLISNGDNTVVLNYQINNDQTLKIVPGIGWFSNLGIIDNMGTILISGSFKNTKTINNHNGGFINITIDGTIINERNLDFDIDGIINNAGEIFNIKGNILNYGTINNDNYIANNLMFSNMGIINNNNSATFTNTDAGTFSNSDGVTPTIATFNNYGNIINLFDFRNSNYGLLENYGSISNSMVLSNSGTINNYNSGTISNSEGIFNDGILNNYGEITNSESFSNGDFAIFNNYGTTENSFNMGNTGMFNNEGIFINNGEFYNEIGGNITNAGTIENNYRIFNYESTINNGGTINNNNYTFNTGTINNKLSGIINNNDRFENIIGATINNDGIINNNSYILNIGTINNKLSGIINNNGIIDNNSSNTINNYGTINNNNGGTINNNNGGTIYNYGTINNNNGGLINDCGIIIGDISGNINSCNDSSPIADCGSDKLKCENFNTPVQFNASASYDPDGSILSYEWDFGDGTTGTGVAPNHTYTSYRWNGNTYLPFTVHLNVSNILGTSNITSQKVTLWLAGDANGDGVVNILDASVVGLNWGGSDACADLNNDGKVNILDASIIGLNWNKKALDNTPPAGITHLINAGFEGV